MAPTTVRILRPRSLTEATSLLVEHGDQARLVAGATAITLLLRQRLIAPRYLITLAGLPDMRSIELVDGCVHLGALVTHRQVELSPIVRDVLPVLAETFGRVGNVRVRTMATVGGVLAEADYASDPPCVLLALGALVEVAGHSGERRISADQFFEGFFETALAPDEIVTGVRVPIPPMGTRAVYDKYVTRSSEDRPCLGVAALVRMEGGLCAHLRVVVGAAADTPQRLPHAEALGHGQAPGPEVAQAVADAYADAIDTVSDLRGSAWYRTEMIRVWVRRAILRAAA
ncbi:MAG: xanthine dehydrogenase family protein subunit M [Chloroflexi bacterium]|nr:xanthine dehydrogenase family protein subunit M [Chloroflexota bacterium]